MKNFTFKQNTKFIPLVLCLLIYQITKAQDQEFVRQQYTPAEPACVYYADNYRGAHSTFRSQAVANNMSRGSACSSFIVTYNGFTPEAEAAFQFAVDIWANSIESSQPIRINANFAPLNAGVLGQAGPTNFFTSNAPGALPDVFYPIALWEKLEDRDSEDPPPFGNSDSVDISCTFSSTFNFYFGTDANPPNGQFDFVSIVLHELGHGLGFVGLASSDGSEGTIRVGNPPRPSVYSNFIENGSNTSILGFDDPSMALQNQLTGNNLFCNGEGGEFVPFDPDDWRPVLPQAMLAVEILMSQEDRVSERVDRGSRVFGKTEGWISVQNPRVGELDVISQFLRGRPEDITRGDVVRVNRIMQSYFDKYGYSTLARRHGLTTMRIDGVMQFVGQCLFRLDPEDPVWAAGSAYRDPLWGTADDRAQPAAGSGDRFGGAWGAPGPSAGPVTGGM